MSDCNRCVHFDECSCNPDQICPKLNPDRAEYHPAFEEEMPIPTGDEDWGV